MVAKKVIRASPIRYTEIGQDAPPAPKEHFITVNEPGHPSLNCQLLKMWSEPDGSKAYVLRVVETNEMLTVVEAPKGKSTRITGRSNYAPTALQPSQPVSMSVFHWFGTQPPVGTPKAPADATVFGDAGQEPAAAATHHAASTPKRWVSLRSIHPTWRRQQCALGVPPAGATCLFGICLVFWFLIQFSLVMRFDCD